MPSQRPPRATILDVARAAGVSITTVSHVVNGTKAVSPSARSRVEQAVVQLGYRPSHLARSLRSRRSATVGVLLSHIGTGPINQLLKGIVDALARRGYAALLADSEGSRDREDQELRRFAAREVDGCIVHRVGASASAGGAPAACAAPCVSLGAPAFPGGAGAVVADIGDAVRDATAWALRLGPRAAFVIGHVESIQRREAFDAYLLAHRRAGAVPDEALVCTMPPTPEGGYKAMQRLLRLRPAVGAVIVPDAPMTTGALEMWRDARPKGGAPVLVGVDAGAWYPGFGPAVGRIVVPSYDMGARAVELLEGAWGPEPGVPQTVRLPARFLPAQPVGDAADGSGAAL